VATAAGPGACRRRSWTYLGAGANEHPHPILAVGPAGGGAHARRRRPEHDLEGRGRAVHAGQGGAQEVGAGGLNLIRCRVWGRGRPLPQCLALLVELEPRYLQVPDHPLAELVPGIVGCVLTQQPAEEVTAPRHGEADGEHELGTERPVIHERRRCS
jgi:hypothetical protein